ncbi:bifunctional metallophosphatase/5'-nucleotidase [Maribacter hydrothermalis]|uniref:Bifunctional metallophosphatase/5'-nucleotidase n=1 Tax=Maribacter hydrothermalis TaxID=1836467 RepID=A0A1B7Z8Q0_9FLAO|nr:bifunctional metallophosphatase/5'-nucleotidase [Maribacter hydrothermalis]APQ19047.1 bifunctional metallophosphatase/5'-nucleotidase [Maribacter hydrothermalis]OBR38940.1 bifunctional metallophosphatase/5'-nucleotidase [Maribacter hydrothermalis]
MKLNILFVNDVHGYLKPHPELFYNANGENIETAGGYAHMAGIIAEIRKKNPNTLLFDGGDTLHGTKPLVDTKGEAVIPILNALKIDALVGHWDFAFGPTRLQKIKERLNFPVLGCNVFNEDGSQYLQPTMMLEKNGIKIGVIGISAMIIDKVMPEKMSKGLTFTSGREEVPKYISQLMGEGAHIIVLLSHNGFPQDVRLLQEISGVDICLSAHTHNRIYEAIEVGDARIVQCGCHGAFVGNFTLELDDKKITGYDYELIKVTESSPKDEKVEQLVNMAILPYKKIREQIVGSTTQTLHRYATINSTMDELLLSAIALSTDTEIAFSNGWRYGAPIPKGNITENDLYNIAPMNPPVSRVVLTGAEIKGMLEENLERTFNSDPFGQMGGYVKRCLGLQINMRIENPTGHRIQEINFNGAPLDPKTNYNVSFVTSQGVAKKYGVQREEHKIKAVEAMIAYLKKIKDFQPGNRPVYRLV